MSKGMLDHKEELLEQINKLEALLKKNTDLSSIDFDKLMIKEESENHMKLISQYNQLLLLLKSMHTPAHRYYTTMQFLAYSLVGYLLT